MRGGGTRADRHELTVDWLWYGEMDGGILPGEAPAEWQNHRNMVVSMDFTKMMISGTGFLEVSSIYIRLKEDMLEMLINLASYATVALVYGPGFPIDLFICWDSFLAASDAILRMYITSLWIRLTEPAGLGTRGNRRPPKLARPTEPRGTHISRLVNIIGGTMS